MVFGERLSTRPPRLGCLIFDDPRTAAGFLAVDEVKWSIFSKPDNGSPVE
jgi:hypothetical protein